MQRVAGLFSGEQAKLSVDPCVQFGLLPVSSRPLLVRHDTCFPAPPVSYFSVPQFPPLPGLISLPLPPSPTPPLPLACQSRLPHARVLYCSSMGASDLRHLAFMTRLGLWDTHSQAHAHAAHLLTPTHSTPRSSPLVSPFASFTEFQGVPCTCLWVSVHL